MSLEFVVQYSCALRARYPEARLRAWGKLYGLHARLTVGEQFAPDAEKIRFVEDSARDIGLIQSIAEPCAHCVARLPEATAGLGEAFGCQGRVNYPISAYFEKFLADRVQLALDTLDHKQQPRLLRILVSADSPFDGAATYALRQVTDPHGLRFFEARAPISLIREAAHLTTDNIFDMLAGFSSPQSEKSTYNRELPYEATLDYGEFLHLLLRYDVTASEQKRLHAHGPNYRQHLRLLAAIERAHELETSVLLD